MFYWLTHWPTDYTLTDRLEAPRGLEPIDLSTPLLAEQFVVDLHHDPFSRYALLDIAYHHVFGPGAGYSERELISQIAREISLGSILVFEGKVAREELHWQTARLKPGAPKAPAAPVEKAHSFSVKVVDDRTGRPIPDVKVVVGLADGSTRPCTTGRDGCVEIQQVEPGSYAVSCPIGGATLARTLEFVSMGESPGGGKAPGAKKKVPGKTTAREAGHRPVSSIVSVKAYKVKWGDTLSTIAGAHQLTQGELAQFNWGVRSTGEIERRLRDEVGCRKRDEEGRYLLDDADEPGVIYVPQTWSQRGLAVDQRYTIRVRPVARVLPDLRFHYQNNPHAPNAQNDTLTLETEDGSWSHELPVSALSEVHPGWVELVFPEPPIGQTFNLVQDPKDEHEPFYVFRGVSYGELLEAHAEQVTQDTAGE